MDGFPRDSLIEAWYEQIDGLESEEEEIEANQDSWSKAEWPAAFERAEPRIKRNQIQSCIEDLEGCSDIDDVLATLGGWRDEVDDRDKRIMDQKEWFRNNLKRLQLDKCVEDVVEKLPEELFEECRCGEQKMPTEDRRYSEGYRWECVNDDCYR